MPFILKVHHQRRIATNSVIIESLCFAVPPPTPKKVAVVQVINDEVIISTVVDIIHDGHYSGKLATSRGSMLIGFIYNECTEQKFSKTHVCSKFLDP